MTGLNTVVTQMETIGKQIKLYDTLSHRALFILISREDTPGAAPLHYPTPAPGSAVPPPVVISDASKLPLPLYVDNCPEYITCNVLFESSIQSNLEVLREYRGD